MKQTLITTLAMLLAFGVGMAVVYSLGNSLVSMQQQKVKAEAVQGCMEVSSFTFVNGEGVTTVEPIEKTYSKCLELKGIK